MENLRASFATTSWTLVLAAGNNPDDLARLLERYWQPVYAFLRRRGSDQEDAADLTQGFLTDVMLSGNLLSRAAPHRGRFRSYLLTALRNYTIDQHRRNRQSDTVVKLPEDPNIIVKPTDDPATAFDRQWATNIFDLAVRRTRRACRAEGRSAHWQAFELRVLRPTEDGSSPPDLPDVASTIRCPHVAEVSQMIYTVKRKLRRILRQTIEETVEEPRQVEEELADLRRILSG